MGQDDDGRMFQYCAISIPVGQVDGVLFTAAHPPVDDVAAARGGGTVEDDSSDDGDDAEADDVYSIDSELSDDVVVTETQVDIFSLPERFDPNLSDEEDICETQF